MCGAVHHPLPYQSRASRRHALDLDAQLGGDVARTMWAGSELRHGSEILLLGWGEPIHADSEEILIKATLDVTRGKHHVIQCDWRFRGRIPDVIAPLLKKVGIPLGVLQQPVEGGQGKLDALSLGRRRQHGPRVVIAKRADLWKIEEPLRI